MRSRDISASWWHLILPWSSLTACGRCVSAITWEVHDEEKNTSWTCCNLQTGARIVLSHSRLLSKKVHQEFCSCNWSALERHSEGSFQFRSLNWFCVGLVSERISAIIAKGSLIKSKQRSNSTKQIVVAVRFVGRETSGTRTARAVSARHQSNWDRNSTIINNFWWPIVAQCGEWMRLWRASGAHARQLPGQIGCAVVD